MASCLGLYVENNIIKYAKVSKDHENIRIDAFGVKFYDNLDEAIKQVINETYSYKTPISVNLTDEKYSYANLFSLLNKKDLEKAINTEFDYFCNENNKNRNALEYRKIIVPNLEDKDKVTSLYVYSDKSNVAGKLQMLDGYTISNITPLPLAIPNIKENNIRNNSVIVNIEKNTSVTFIVNGKIYRVEIIDTGMKEILDNIKAKENSYSKAYEICKNTTIYTSQGRNLQVEENEYMEDIMPVLYRIVERVKEIITESRIQINDIYITGLATSINNIDLYFQENFSDKKCEILTPFFIKKSNLKLNIKDYIEVNSAIALALQGIGIGDKDINFKNKSIFDKLSKALNIEIGSSKTSNKKENENKNNFTTKLGSLVKPDFDKPLDKIEIGMIRICITLLILLVVYGIFTNVISNKTNNKNDEVEGYITDSQEKISTVANNTRLINERKDQYDTLVNKINEQNDNLTQSYARKNALPNFLTQIMFNIPKEVQLISIDNSTGKSIRIEAQSKEYEQLGYFIAKIKTEGILNSVTATSGERQGEFIVITIEGDLPY